MFKIFSDGLLIKNLLNALFIFPFVYMFDIWKYSCILKIPTAPNEIHFILLPIYLNVFRHCLDSSYFTTNTKDYVPYN